MGKKKSKTIPVLSFSPPHSGEAVNYRIDSDYGWKEALGAIRRFIDIEPGDDQLMITKREMNLAEFESLPEHDGW